MAAMTKLAVPMVLEALGMPSKRCTRLTLQFEPNDVVRAEAEYIPDEGQIDGLLKIIRTFKPAE